MKCRIPNSEMIALFLFKYNIYSSVICSLIRLLRLIIENETIWKQKTLVLDKYKKGKKVLVAIVQRWHALLHAMLKVKGVT